METLCNREWENILHAEDQLFVFYWRFLKHLGISENIEYILS